MGRSIADRRVSHQRLWEDELHQLVCFTACARPGWYCCEVAGRPICAIVVPALYDATEREEAIGAMIAAIARQLAGHPAYLQWMRGLLGRPGQAVAALDTVVATRPPDDWPGIGLYVEALLTDAAAND